MLKLEPEANMRYSLKNNITNEEIWTSIFCSCPEEVENEVGEDFFFDAITEAIDSIEPTPKGTFVEKETELHVIRSAKEYINEHSGDYLFISEKVDDNGNVVFSKTISMVDMLNVYLSRMTYDASFCGIISEYVEKCLFQFTEKASWHFATRDIAFKCAIEESCEENTSHAGDILWFGIDDEEPLLPWTISQETTDLSFWFNCDGWNVLSSISDFSDCMKTWYFCEKALECPDIEAIRVQCPVEILIDDTGKSVIEKVKNTR